MNLFDVKDHVAWITGAAFGGLGYYHALTLAEHGAHVVVTDLSSRADDLSETGVRLKDKNVKVMTLHADVSNSDDVQKAITKIEESLGRIDILVNNAATSTDLASLDMPLEEWNRVLNVNLTGTWLCSKAACQLMVKTRTRGKIINIASVYGRQADWDPSAPYYAAKAAVINLTRALALEWASYGISVNAIAPGYFYPTGMTGTLNEKVKERYLSRIPLGRPGDPAKDLMGVLIFLASRASDYLTGQTVYVDGGWTAA